MCAYSRELHLYTECVLRIIRAYLRVSPPPPQSINIYTLGVFVLGGFRVLFQGDHYLGVQFIAFVPTNHQLRTLPKSDEEERMCCVSSHTKLIFLCECFLFDFRSLRNCNTNRSTGTTTTTCGKRQHDKRRPNTAHKLLTTS